MEEGKKRMLSFLAVGDFGASTPIRSSVARTIAIFPHPDAVFALGDNFYDYGIASEDDPRWTIDFEEAFRPRCPWYAVLGNHDYLSDPGAQVRRHGIGHWNMPARYYDKRFCFPGSTTDGVHVFFLDTFELAPSESLMNSQGMGMPMSQWRAHQDRMNARRQLAWLDHGLKNSSMRWKMVVGHYPVFSDGAHGDNPELLRDLLPLLTKHRVDFYLSGHDHHLAHLNEGETQFLVSGMGCRHVAPRSSVRSYSSVPQEIGLAFIRLYRTHARFGFVSEKNISFYRTVLPNATHPRINLISQG